VRIRLFWKLGLTYLVLLLVVLLAVDFYAARVLRRAYISAAEAQLDSLAQLARTRPPELEDPAALNAWAAWMKHSGARATVITAEGVVLADSDHDPETMENHANRPEIQQAMATGEGSSVRHSKTLDRDLVYHAIRFQPSHGPVVVLRFAVPLARINEALAEIRRRLITASLILLLLGGAISLVFSRTFSVRIQRLKEFSRRVAARDFHPLPREESRDELTDLANAMNETAAQLDRTIRTLTDERNRSAAILGGMVEGVAVIDSREKIVFCNRAFVEILDLDAADTEGRSLLEVVRQSDLLAAIRRALETRESVQSEVLIGTVRPRSFSITAAPVAGSAAGETQRSEGAVIVLHDISELRRLERVRRDFVANVSHEFKTPLTAIQGFAETLLGGALDDPRSNRRFVAIIRDHALRLAKLTDDLLILSRIEAGKLELNFRSVRLDELVDPCVEVTRPKAEAHQLTLKVNCPSNFPPVRGDVSKLRQVLQNLLDNAVQYTPAGGLIYLEATMHDGAAVISVADTGIGIPQAEQERIFERFYRVDEARSREVGGTGLGLSIARHIVEAHGGRLRVESAVGQGSRFHFSIPLAS
jgi:two-component system, OmpR family, phosphate regulon sensor histidine kinase PhoR